HKWPARQRATPRCRRRGRPRRSRPQGPSAPQREQRPPAPEPPRRTTSIEDDIPEEDDPDLDESALSGHDLIMRELGATVVEEYTNE
ncbi:DNA polymerase III subunit gamma and tau, partial [Streptomyces albidoflavus]